MSNVDDSKFTELTNLLSEMDTAGMTINDFIKSLEDAASLATRRLELSRQLAELCKPPKKRKPRKDKGTTRSKPEPKEEFSVDLKNIPSTE